METTTSANLELIQTSEIQAIAQSAPVALAANQSSVEKAKAVGQQLLELSKQGMTPELDAKINDYLVKVNTTIKNMKEKREPLTQFLTKIQRTFTGLENELDRATKDSIPAQLQEARNNFAKFVAEENRKAEEKARLEKEKAIERVQIIASIQEQLRMEFNTKFHTVVDSLNDIFRFMSLDSFEQASTDIKNTPTQLFDFIPDFKPKTSSKYQNEEELSAIIQEAKKGQFEIFASEFKGMIERTKEQLIEQLPGKRSSLEEAEQARLEAIEAKRKAEELAAAAKSEAEKKAAQEAAERAEKAKQEEERLAKEEEERVFQQQIKAKQEEEERQRLAQEAAAMKAAAQTAEATFDASVNATPTIEHAAQVRTGYIIEVLTPHGYLMIFQFYFEKEGSKLALDKLEKKSLAQMKTFCEKEAIKTGTKIESPFIVYHDDYTVTAKK
jgi:hypothetical protein